MPHLILATTFEHIQKTRQVAVGISVRIGHRITHPGLRRQMHDTIEFFPGKQISHEAAINQIPFDKAETRVLFKHL